MSDVLRRCTKCSHPKDLSFFTQAAWVCDVCSTAEPQNQAAPASAVVQGTAVAAMAASPAGGSQLMGVEVCASQASSDSPCGTSNVWIMLQPPTGTQRTPVSIVCVIDTSGSMCTAANILTGSGGMEDNGLCVLDVVKHAVRTVIASLNDNDFLSVVSFSCYASVGLPLTAMDEAGKAQANTLVNSFCPDGGTSLWRGLECGLDVLRENDQLCLLRNNAVLLFTDGEPSDSPDGGHVSAFQKYKAEHGLPGVLHTFGFGYSLDSNLLFNLALEGDGAYAFIPDASMVGTVFVHSTANLLVGYATSTTVTVNPLNGATIADSGSILGGHKATFSSSEVTIDLGTMRYDQNKSIALLMKNLPPVGTPYAQVTVNYKGVLSKEPSVISIKGTAHGSDTSFVSDLYRLRFVDTVRKGMEMMAAAADNVDAKSEMSLLAQTIKAIGSSRVSLAWPFVHFGAAADNVDAKSEMSLLAQTIKAIGSSDAELAALLEDVEGQATLAFIPEFYCKWGMHYLPSLSFAHLHQFCNNFKDPGVQVYATGAVFQSIRDTIDEIFCDLPPPTPSRAPTGGEAPANMRSYHSSSNPCFSGDSLVLMADGSIKQACQVRKGDWVCTSLPMMGKQGANSARVICVTVSPCIDGQALLVRLPDGPWITPWHPIRIDGVWQFPAEIQDPVHLPCPAVFNFVLDSGHVMVINGVECVTLGHDFQQPKVRHDFFGSQKVIKSLQAMAGWYAGIVIVGGVVSDPLTGLACGLLEWATAVPCHAPAVPWEQPSCVSIEV